MVLVRRLLGDILRRQRQRQGRTLREVSALAQVSLGYLSEVERGQKEASSELLAAICAALDIPLSEILREMSEDLELHELAERRAAEVGAQRIEPELEQVEQVELVEDRELVEDIDKTVARLADVVAA